MPSMLCYVSVLVARAAVVSPPDWVVSTTDLFFFGILEAGSLRSRCWQSWFLLWPLTSACQCLSSPRVFK